MPALASETRMLALELHHVVRDMDPARLRAAHVSGMSERLQSLEAKLRAHLEAYRDHRPVIRERLHAVAEQLAERMGHDVPADQALSARRARLEPAYEALALALEREAIHVPSLRPTNYARNVLHVFMACFAFTVLVLAWEQRFFVVVPFFFAAVGMEVSRRFSRRANGLLMRLFGPVAHPHEAHRVNSASWYTLALLGLAIAGQKEAAAVGVVVLGFGDPMAALIGRRFGRHALIHGRSLEGTLSFIVAGALAAAAALYLVWPGLGLQVIASMAAAGAVGGALVELFSVKVDDNLTIPWAAAAASALAILALT
ncbi:MAG: hypothetical protein GXP55_08085 [Deltaproteobacteria bacterium]|nr:hypothetical protein [Deltaproteobacteria bacterium]